MTYDTLLFEKHDAAAWVTLNRPEVLNAYNVRMRDELFEVLSAVRDDGDVRVLVLRGAGRAFSTGADLREFGTAPSPTAARRIRFARDVWALLDGLPVPTVASLHGFVLGSGLELALLCDLRIAAEGTQFGMPEVQLGFIPAAGGTQTLARACGPSAALDLLLTGRRFDSTEALSRGILSRVVPAADLGSTTASLVQYLVGLDAPAVRALRQAVREGYDLPLEHGLRLEARLGAALRSTTTTQREAR
jgi:enoyl-CoA hydratase/carnithine racemase